MSLAVKEGYGVVERLEGAVALGERGGWVHG
jgi:hypothetical protein